MLNSAMQQQILDLLNVGVTSAEVRRRTGASRNAIRRLYRQLFSPRKAVRDKLESFDGFNDSQPVGRCPDCGALTRQPCWRCELLKRLDPQQSKPSGPQQSKPSGPQQNKPSDQQLNKAFDQQQSKTSDQQLNKAFDQQQSKTSGQQLNKAFGQQQSKTSGQQLNKAFDQQQSKTSGQQLNKAFDQQQNEPFIDPFGDLTAADSLFGLSLEAICLRGASIEYSKLALKPEHRKRYEQVRRNRLNRGE